MGNLLNDVRYCLRGFARRPMFAVVVVATLALGLSINAAIFSIYDQMLLRELPVPAPDELVNLGVAGPQAGQHVVQRRRHLRRGLQLPDVPRSRARSTGRSSGLPRIAISTPTSRSRARRPPAAGCSSRAAISRCSASRPPLGRLLDSNDDRVDGEASAVVLSYAYWESAFGADPGVVGRTLVVNGKPLTIVGVAPRGFHGTTVGERPHVFVPITFRWLSNPDAFPNHADRKSYWAYLVRALEARRVARASGSGDQRAVSHASSTTSTRRC